MPRVCLILLWCKHSSRVVGASLQALCAPGILPPKEIADGAGLGRKLLCDVGKAALIAMNVGFPYLQY